jgi:hypothetical protein
LAKQNQLLAIEAVFAVKPFYLKVIGVYYRAFNGGNSATGP